MAPRVDPVPSDDRLPARAEVVVIGGGIAGVCTALALAERRVEVALFEKGRIAGEQSSRNWGWCRQMGRDPRELPLVIESLRLWRDMNRRVGAETGFRQAGVLYTCVNEAELAKREAWLAHARPYQLDSRVVAGAALDHLLPGAARRWPGALYTAGDGRAEPTKAAPAIAAAARRAGASVVCECAVRGIETQGGRVSGVVTEKGRLACASVVLAGGAWSRLFCRSLGLTLPQLKTISSAMRTAPVDGAPEVSAWDREFAFRKRLDGGYTVAHGGVTVVEIVPDSFRLLFDFLPIAWLERADLRLRLSRRFLDEWSQPARWALDRPSPFEYCRVLDPEPLDWVLDSAWSNLQRAFPAFSGIAIEERWAGLIDVTPDAVPVISAVTSLPGFHLATGFSGHGFGVGPAAGRLMADLVTGTAPVVDPAPFRFSRFTDGPRPRPIAGV